MNRIHVVVGLLIALTGVTSALDAQSLDLTDTSGASLAMDRIVHDLCGKRIALLTEPSTHGFGNTLAFKAGLVRRLVNECHYSAFLIESGIYDFVDIRRRLRAHETVTDSMVAAAIGGIWDNGDMRALIPFLLDNARRSRLTLGGIDDQLGRGSWAQTHLAAELVQGLTPPDSGRCLAVLQRHLLWQYTDEAPFNREAKIQIVGCLDETAASHARQSDRTGYRVLFAENMKRALAHEFPDTTPGVDVRTYSFDARDRAMYLNFQWWLSRLPPRSKVIVWTATVHGAKSLRGVPREEKVVSMGSSIHRQFGAAAFVLAFSADRGTYRFARQPERTLAIAPDSTLEGRVFLHANAGVQYLNRDELRRFVIVAARPFGTDFEAAEWSEVIDGLVVFREERTPRP